MLLVTTVIKIGPMYSKIYSGVIAASIALMAFFTYYSWSWLQSIGLPAAAVDGYQYHSNLAWYALWVTFAALLILGNAVLWSTRSSWALWTSLVYFSVFILINYFWLDQEAFRFKKSNGLWDGSFSLSPLLGVIFVIAAGVIVFADQFIAVRLYRKMYPPIVDEAPVDTVKEAEPDPE